jgi:methionyl-tRNA formyltransferase
MIKILFFGTPSFAVPTLEALTKTSKVEVSAVITQPDRPSGRGGLVTPPPVKALALQHSIPVFQPTSLRKQFSELRAQLDQLGPFDLGVVVAFGQILPQEVLSYPRRGCVNIHGSLLPRWRGAAPIQRAIEAGDAETGVCLMQMEVGLDTGPVFATRAIPITESDTTASLQESLSRIGAEMLVADLQAIVAGSISPVAQALEGVVYAHKITSVECRIDWQKEAAVLTRQIRAFSPHPGCYTVWNGRRLKITQARTVAMTTSPDSSTSPGTVIRAAPDSFTVQCGRGGLLAIEEVQLEGKKRMTTAEFLRGVHIAPGTQLDVVD